MIDRIWKTVLGLVLFLAACTPSPTGSGAANPPAGLFWTSPTGLLFGLALGNTLPDELEIPGFRPVLVDSLGRVFSRADSGGIQTDVELYANSEGRIRSVVVNLSAGTENEVRRLYRELVESGSKRVGFSPQGRFGELVWELPDNRQTLELRLNAGGRALTLNWAPEKAGN